MTDTQEPAASVVAPNEPKKRTRKPRPLSPSVASLRILRDGEILDLFRIGRTTLWRWRREEGFPKPCRLGPGTNGTPEELVREWLASRPAA